MKKLLPVILFSLITLSAWPQSIRPDAFPPVEETLSPKSLSMATTLDEMYQWNRYPTYEVYVEMMNHFADTYPTLCRLDTLGTSVNGRLILALAITGSDENDLVRPPFYYTSTMHGDEITGFYFMLRLCDTLLSSYGLSRDITNLLNSVVVYINPLSNPDGTYRGGNNTVANAVRYNANSVDLNRNFPDPFGTNPLDSIQPENIAQINYAQQHHFRMSANLHGGSEVMNYPWDSFTSAERPHEHAEWWKQVSKRYVDTCRLSSRRIFSDVNSNGYIAGGDWYVIPNGRQDYFNYVHHTLELTMEVSSTKKLPSEQLIRYWNIQSRSLINYIKEVLSLPTDPINIPATPSAQIHVYPNPTRGPLYIDTPEGTRYLDLSNKPAGIHILQIQGKPVKIIKL